MPRVFDERGNLVRRIPHYLVREWLGRGYRVTADEPQPQQEPGIEVDIHDIQGQWDRYNRGMNAVTLDDFITNHGARRNPFELSWDDSERKKAGGNETVPKEAAQQEETPPATGFSLELADQEKADEQATQEETDAEEEEQKRQQSGWGI